jgi:hypothetical protein
VEVSNIELTVSSPELDAPRVFKLEKIDTGGRSAKTSIKIPLVNSLNFSAKAFQGNCPKLSGKLENVKIAVDQTTPVVIKLDPIQIIIGVRSSQKKLTVGDTYTAEVFINDSPGIFAFTCELRFDENLLVPISFTPGDFFGEKDNVLFIEESQLPRRQPGRITIGATLRGNTTGLCGSGTAFNLTFRAAGSGNATIGLMRNDMLKLITPYPDFAKIEDSRIIIENDISVTIE